MFYGFPSYKVELTNTQIYPIKAKHFKNVCVCVCVCVLTLDRDSSMAGAARTP